ncbi:unnamed protein product [Choristocarpus tenellus]
MQSLPNTQDVLVCRNCLAFIGDIITHLELLAGVPRNECVGNFLHRQSKAPKVCTQRDGLPGVFGGVYECPGGCGEVYCSPSCTDEHFTRCHGLLCVGPVPEEEAMTHPLVAFRVHAMKTNEIFLLVAEVVCQVVSTFLNNGDVFKAQEAFRDFVQEPWWDVAVAREGDTAALPSTLAQLCEESSAFLRSALPPFPEFEKILCKEAFGRVVGMFEQNNVGVRVASPLEEAITLALNVAEDNSVVAGLILEVHSLLEMVLEDSEDEDVDCCLKESSSDPLEEKECWSGGSLKVEDRGPDSPGDTFKSAVESLPKCLKQASDEVFQPLDGTALYSLICCMNHSCLPNCIVRYPDRMSKDMFGSGRSENKSLPMVAAVIATQDIEEGEELCQSYVDNNLALYERRALLEDYGFLCNCLRCLEEEKVGVV